MQHFLFKRIDNAQLIIFRVCYGLLVCMECFGAIATGWVHRVFIAPKFTFTFIGFDWLQPLPGNGMYFYFALMGILGILITVGYRYRLAAFGFAFMWTGVYLMQKTAYNNHYYLLMLLAFIMAFFPANRNLSLDAKLNPAIKTDLMPNYIRWIIILQLFIVYTYAAVAKLYGDWFDLTVIEVLMQGKKELPVLGEVLQQRWTHWIIAGFGIVFDLLVVPALLWKPTRKIAFVLGIFFHLFNSIVFQIGIFPYLSLAFCLFFFEPQTLRKLFFRGKEVKVPVAIWVPAHSNLLLVVLGVYFTVQLVLPLRHLAIKGDVLWTEEGHRLSWRMMLRSRQGLAEFTVVDKATQEKHQVDLGQYLSKKQQRKVGCYPDYIWQFAQHLKKEYQAKGKDVGVYVSAKVKVNKGPWGTFIDPRVDLAAVPWQHFTHHEWILPQENQ